MVFVFPKLPYAYNALVPFVDPLTMELHHMKHHQTYVNKANQLIQTVSDLLPRRSGYRESVGF